MVLQCSSLYCRVGLDSGQWFCNAGACIAELDFKVARAVAMPQLVLKCWT